MMDVLNSIQALAQGMARSVAPAGDDRPAARLPSIVLDNLRLNADGRLDPVVFYSWRLNIENAIERMRLPEETVVQLLRTKNHLPEAIRATVQNASTLPELMHRIGQAVPDLRSAVSVVVAKISGQPILTSQDPHVREARATELTLALEDLFKLFPERDLVKSEAIASLISIQPLDVHAMDLVNGWVDEAERPGGLPIKRNLYRYLERLKQMSAEARFITQTLGNRASADSSRSHMHFRQSGGAAGGNNARPARNSGAPAAPGGPPATAANAAKPRAAGQAAPLLPCRVCKQKHKERFSNCPKLLLIQQRKSQFPSYCCRKCLRNLANDGSCPGGAECYIFINSRTKAKYNFLCKAHSHSHFSICVSCPPRKEMAKITDQKVVLRFRAVSTPRDDQFLTENDAWEEKVALKLQRSATDEVLLDDTSPMSEVVPIWNPVMGRFNDALVQYDSAGGLCLIQDGSKFNLKTHAELAAAVTIQSLNSTDIKQYPVITVKLKGLDRNVVMELCETQFPWEPPRPELRAVRFAGGIKARLPSREQIAAMPKILLGIRAAIFMPEAVPADQIPPEFKRNWPNLAVFKSRLTGKLIFSGMLSKSLAQRSKDQLIQPLLAFAAAGAGGQRAPALISLSHANPKVLSQTIESPTKRPHSSLGEGAADKQSTESTPAAATASMAEMPSEALP